MRCNKCGTQSPDSVRFCPVCGHKLQSDRQPGTEGADTEGHAGNPEGSSRRLLDFQGWSRSGRGSGRYVEACLYAVVLLVGVVLCLKNDLTWPLYPLLAALGLAAWLRRL